MGVDVEMADECKHVREQELSNEHISHVWNLNSIKLPLCNFQILSEECASNLQNQICHISGRAPYGDSNAIVMFQSNTPVGLKWNYPLYAGFRRGRIFVIYEILSYCVSSDTEIALRSSWLFQWVGVQGLPTECDRRHPLDRSFANVFGNMCRKRWILYQTTYWSVSIPIQICVRCENFSICKHSMECQDQICHVFQRKPRPWFVICSLLTTMCILLLYRYSVLIAHLVS